MGGVKDFHLSHLYEMEEDDNSHFPQIEEDKEQREKSVK